MPAEAKRTLLRHLLCSLLCCAICSSCMRSFTICTALATLTQLAATRVLCTFMPKTYLSTLDKHSTCKLPDALVNFQLNMLQEKCLLHEKQCSRAGCNNANDKRRR